jgi:hypothetical protein
MRREDVQIGLSVRLIAGNGHPLYGMSPLRKGLRANCLGTDVVLDGELAVTDDKE